MIWLTISNSFFSIVRIEFTERKIHYLEDELDYYVTGIENSDGSIGTLIVDSTPYLKNRYAIELQPWLLLNSNSGELAGGTSTTIDVKFDAQILNENEDDYYNTILIRSNDPVDPYFEIPVELSVIDYLGVPQNIATEVIDTKVTISWDPINGAESYYIYASVKPYSNFQDLTGFGNFNTDTEWTVPYAGQKMFFYVVSSKADKKIEHIFNVTDEMILEYLTK